MRSYHQELTTTALLAVLILVVGAFKIPSPFPGGEFQLSAPLAVLICALFGFRKYITAGILASFLGLMLGTANIFNVIIAMVFRLVVGLILYFGKTNYIALALSGPVGTFCARLILAIVTGVSWKLLAIAALPGMIFTAISSVLLYKPALKLMHILFLEGSVQNE